MTENNGRVSNKELYQAITDLRKELRADLKELDHKVDCLNDARGLLSERVAAVETEVGSLKVRLGAWDIGNTVGVVIAGVLAYLGFDR